MGDFNEILAANEKSGGSLRSQWQMNDFRDAIRNWNLKEIPFDGSMFTWSRGNTPQTRIAERLDRAIATGDFMHMFHTLKVNHIDSNAPNHSPIVLSTETGQFGWELRSIEGKRDSTLKLCGLSTPTIEGSYKIFGSPLIVLLMREF